MPHSVRTSDPFHPGRFIAATGSAWTLHGPSAAVGTSLMSGSICFLRPVNGAGEIAGHTEHPSGLTTISSPDGTTLMMLNYPGSNERTLIEVHCRVRHLTSQRTIDHLSLVDLLQSVQSPTGSAGSRKVAFRIRYPFQPSKLVVEVRQDPGCGRPIGLHIGRATSAAP